MSVIEKLLDENNDENIFLYDEDDKKIEFEQLAVIPHGEKIYAVLNPITKIDDLEEGEVVIVYVDTNEDGDDVLTVERDPAASEEVFNLFIKLLEEEGE